MTIKALEREHDFVVGTLLGDGHLSRSTSGARLEISHSEKQRAYLLWKWKVMRRFISSDPYCVSHFDSRYATVYTQWKLKTRRSKFFSLYHDKFYDHLGRKIVPSDISRLLVSPFALAVWFMDDGGRRNDCYGMFLNTLSFTLDENGRLAKVLKTNFEVEASIHWVKDGYRLYVPSRYAMTFSNLIGPHLLRSMSYKLSYNPVTTSFARLDRARDRKK